MSTTFRNILLYSTWLVLGVSEIGLGGERLVMSWREGGSAFSYVVGATLISGGAALLSGARKVVKLKTTALVRGIRLFTVLLVVLVFGTPLAHVMVYSLAILSGKAEANPAFYRSLIILVMIFIGYLAAAGWASRRLKHPALSPNGHGQGA